ncbi:MAG: 4Fe-4S binding protein [Desulfovibrio sp.]|jgi:ech hydrogenase subunit F|nr:4Fe-4S binding protein [Desulfovibrio sp.]
MYMLKNVLRNLSNRPATRLYPFEDRAPFPAYRGRIHNAVEECIFCSSCARLCPTGAIAVDSKAGRWEYDPFLCVYCSVCVEKCPTKCLKQECTHRTASVSKFLVSRTGTPRVKKAKAEAREQKAAASELTEKSPEPDGDAA